MYHTYVYIYTYTQTGCENIRQQAIEYIKLFDSFMT